MVRHRGVIMDWLIIIIKGTAIFLTISIFFMLGHGFGTGTFNLNVLTKKSIQPIDCNLETLTKSVECLNADFNSWFVYNLSNIGKTLPESDLKALGGVCTHATEWYKQHLDSFGYLTQKIIIYPKELLLSGHQFLIAYDEKVNSYCLIDQDLIKCVKLGQVELEVDND
jgi:hypothetical protein